MEPGDPEQVAEGIPQVLPPFTGGLHCGKYSFIRSSVISSCSRRSPAASLRRFELDADQRVGPGGLGLW